MTRIAVVACVLALIVAGAALAASAPVWTAKQANAALVARSTKLDLISTQGLIAGEPGWAANGNGTKERGDAFFHTITAAKCAAIAEAAFRCALTLSRSPSPGVVSSTYWVREWAPGSACLSDRSLAACPPATPAVPLSADPRVCSLRGAPVYCILQAATQAVLKNGGSLAGLGCQAKASFVYRCTWGFPPPNTTPPGSATISFVKGKTAWSTRVTANG